MPGNRNAIGKWPLNREISYLISHKMFNNKKRLFWCALGVLTKAALYIQMQSAQCVLHYYVCLYHWYVEMPICTLCIAQYLSQSCIDYEYSKSKSLIIKMSGNGLQIVLFGLSMKQFFKKDWIF